MTERAFARHAHGDCPAMHLLSLYGLPRVSIDHAAPLTLSAREAALLAWLHLEGPTPRAVIAGRLWPQGDESKARANLRQTLTRLKRAAGEVIAETDGVLTLAPGVTVAAEGEARLLGPIEFDDAPELAEWLAARRETQQRDQQREGSAAAREHLARGDLDAALSAADALLARDPAIEEAHRLRMEVHYLRGDRAAAIAAWDECKLALRAAFGIAPSAPTQDLGALILASAATPAAAYASRRLPAALRRPPHLVGRESVLHDIERSFALGHGVVVAGVGGIGKSRLMAEAAARLQPSISVAARPGDAVLPGAVASRLVAAAIERFAPELDAVTRADIACLMPSAEGSTHALRSALEHRRVLASVARTMLACHAKGMLLVVVDDLQFADDESMAAIQIVVGGWLADPPASAALPMFGARPAELRPAAAALVAMMDGSGRSTRFDLAPLAAPDVRRLLDDLPLDGEVDREALAAALHAQIGGNPAYLLESLKALWLDGLDRWRAGQPLPLPSTLVESVRQRLARLPEEALRLAQLAAVARTDFSSALAAAAFGRSPMQLAPLWAALESAQVFDGPGFGHDLMAEAVERSLGAALRSALHRLVAEHLVTAGAAPSSIAHHWNGAGDRRAAATWRLRSAQQARARWQMPEAAYDFEQAAAALDAEGERAGACVAWRDAARCWSRCDEDARAAAALDAADALARTTRERLLIGATRIAQQVNASELDAAVHSAARLIDDLPAVRANLDATELAEAARFVCATVPYGLPLQNALALCDAAQQALAGDDGAGLVELRAARGGALHWAAQLREAEVELAAAWGTHVADAAQKIGLGNRLARVRHSLGDIDGALEAGESALALAERMGAGPGTVVDLMQVLAMMQLGQGRPAAALVRLDDALARLRETGAEVTDQLACHLALAHVAVGHPDEAERWLACHEAPGRAGFALQDLMYFTAQARLAVARDASPQGALRGLDTLLRMPLPQGPLLQGRVTLLQWQPCPAAEVRAVLAELRERGMKTLLRCALGGAARAAVGEGRHADAVAHVQEALALSAYADIWCEEPAQLWCTAHEVLARCGLHDEAAAARATGASWVQATAQQWPQGPQREAWLRANPLHRTLLGAGRPHGSG